ncbi:MAG: hypothetical protein QXD15_06925 [Thermoplasmata archaeon]
MELLIPVLLLLIFSTPVLLAVYIKISRKFHKLLRIDRNKVEKRGVPTAGGFFLLPVISCAPALLLGNFGISLALGVIVAGFIGLVDDLKGTGIWIKVPLMMVPSLPLIVFWAMGSYQVEVPWILAWVPFWLLLPLLTSFFSNGFNIISGYDGLSTGIGAIQIGTLGVLALLANDLVLASLALVCLLPVTTLLLFNWYPSKVFPGNSGTFIIGTVGPLLFIYGGFWLPLIILFLPHICEFLLKVRFRGKTEVFGEVDHAGSINYKGKPKSVVHLLLRRGRWMEVEVTEAFLSLEVMLALIAVALVLF